MRDWIAQITKTIILISLCFSAQALFANAPGQVSWQHQVWQHIPIDVQLPLGKEKILRFPHSVSLGIPGSIRNKLSIQNNEGWLYITAYAPFAETDVQVKDHKTGFIILMHFAAHSHASDNAISIIYPKAHQGAENNDQNSAQNPLNGEMAYVLLTRFAQQQLYAPKRLQSNPYHISLVESYANKEGQVPMSKWIYHFLIDGSVSAVPWAQWHGGQYYVTALMIQNQLPSAIDLRQSLNMVCGRLEGKFKALTYFPFTDNKQWLLSPSGKSGDRTMAFLISKDSFEDSIGSCS